MAAVAGADVVVVSFRLHKIPLFLQVLHDLLAALVAVHSMVRSAVFIDSTIVADAADHLQMVPLAHLKVIGIVGGGHLHCAGSKAQLHVIVCHNGDLPVHDGQDAGLSDQVPKPLVLWVHGNAGVSHHRLRTGGGHHQIAGAIRERVANMPEMTRLVHILHLRVGEGGDTVGTPIDNSASLVDEPLIIQLAEGLPHRFGAALVHGEAGSAPVTGNAHLFLLGNDSPAIGLLPLPYPLEELLPPQVIAGQALLGAQLLFHLDLGSDAGVISARNPECGVALHPLKAGQDVLEGAVHGVTHVELPRYIGGRHDNGKGLFRGIRVSVKAAALLPHRIDALFHLLRFIHLWQFFVHLGILLF